MPPTRFDAVTRALATQSSRRRLLARAGGMAAVLALAPAHLRAQHGAADQLLAAGFPLPSTLAADASPEFRAIADALVAAMRQYAVPGTALGILAGDREEHATFGVASLSSLRPVTADTLFQIGSLTKTFTATAIWRLIDEGALALDAPVRTYLPDLRLSDEATAATVTVRNLLNHTAGWYGDEGFDTGDDDGALARYVVDRLPVLPQQFPCGQFFSYNNAAFQLLGRLIEVTTGTTYNAAMQQLLLGPLGLADSLIEHDAVLRRPYADGHIALPVNGRDVLTVQTPLWVPRSVDPAGGIWSTTRDLLRYARFHLGAHATAGRATTVRPVSLRRMQEPAAPIPGLPLQMGLDWFIQEVAGVRAIFHGGDTNGQHTELVLVPERGFAVVLLTNGQGGGSPAAQAVLDEALAHYPGLGPLAGQVGLLRALRVPADTPTVTRSPEHLAAYAGRYADPGLAVTFTPTAAGLERTAETTPQPGAYRAAIEPPPSPTPLPVTFLAEDMGVLAGQLRLPFVRNAAGRVSWVSEGLRLLPRVGAA
jgi:CubicO group peptidase (beta-lactamase class C family)